MNVRKAALRSARILHFAFLTAAILYVVVILRLKPAVRRLEPGIVPAIGFVCLLVVGVAAYCRSKMVTKFREQASPNFEDGDLIKRWRSGVMLSFICAETIVLFGLVLKVLGASWNISGVFFAVGILLLLASAPRLEIPSD